eukprot:1161226-Pelagomonas_calceolata.AAC.7
MASRLAARSGNLESLEGLLVYLDLLLARGQPREALALVTGPVGGGVLRLAEERALLHADLAAACGEVGRECLRAVQLLHMVPVR